MFLCAYVFIFFTKYFFETHRNIGWDYVPMCLFFTKYFFETHSIIGYSAALTNTLIFKLKFA